MSVNKFVRIDEVLFYIVQGKQALFYDLSVFSISSDLYKYQIKRKNRAKLYG